MARRAAPTPEQRAAQRLLVGIGQGGAGLEVGREGLTLWRPEPVVAADTTEVSEALDLLGVPHEIVLRGTGHRRSGPLIRTADLDALAAWCPAFVRRVRAALDAG